MDSALARALAAESSGRFTAVHADNMASALSNDSFVPLAQQAI
jgi:hypothetical protein